MTNKELASWLEHITPDFAEYTSPVSEYLREAAERLLTLDYVTMNLNIKVAEDALQREKTVAKDAEIASLRALVKELAGLANSGLCYLDCIGCPLDEKCESKRRREIIAKAWEMCK